MRSHSHSHTLTLSLSRSLSRQSRALSRTLYRYDSPRSLGLSTGTSPVRLAAGNLTCALVLYSTEYSGSLQDGAISHLLGRPSLWLLSRLVLQDLDFSRPSFDVWSTLLCCSYLYHRSLDFGQLSRLCMGVHRGAAHISHLPRRGLDLSRGVSNRRPRHYTFS